MGETVAKESRGNETIVKAMGDGREGVRREGDGSAS